MAVTFQFDFDRALAAMVYIASKKPRSLDVYKLCKLVFLADKLHLVRRGRPITGDIICAMPYGPVPSNTYRLLDWMIDEDFTDEGTRRLAHHISADRTFKYPRLSVNPDARLDIEHFLSKSDLKALDEVIDIHGGKSFDELKALTHEMPSYRKVWVAERSSNNPPMLFEDLFEEDSDALRGSFEEMIENDELRRAYGATRI